MKTSHLDSKLPLYQKLAKLLEQMISDQALRPGDRMPSVRQFARQQRVSVPTAMSAFSTLEIQGVIKARPKSGFFVRACPTDSVPPPALAKHSLKVTDLAEQDPSDALMADHSDPRYVPLGAAVPSYEWFPGLKLAREMGAIARRMGPACVGYDVAPGSELLRREIARQSLDWGCALKADDFVVTNGCTEALALSLAATCEPGDTVIVESPTYFGLANMLREFRLKALPIPVHSTTGMDLDLLATAVQKHRVSAAVLIANFHNPVGCLMPDAHKKIVLELLSVRGIPLIEDDVYGDLQHDGPRPHSFKAFGDPGDVILCGSYSKKLAPGYRVGYVAPGRWHDKVLGLKRHTSMGNATLPTLAVAEFLRHGGFDRHLRALRLALKQQVQQMREAVVASFPEGIGLSRPQGNFVLWCELPEKVDSIELFQRARKAGISLAPGPLFSTEGAYRNYIRLSCGHPWSPKIERSVAVLGHLACQLAGQS